MKKAYYHLPGLFEFYELYRRFLPLYQEHREYFYEWCEIASIYGAPATCLWAGGRVELADCAPKDALALCERYGISARLTFSNSLLEEKDLEDVYCNNLCKSFRKNGVIVHSDRLVSYLREKYPDLYLVSSTTKVLTEEADLARELARPEFTYVVPDFRLNKEFDFLQSLSQKEKDKVEFLCNECCSPDCQERKACYEAVSRKNLGLEGPEHYCRSLGAEGGYLFSKAMENPTFISLEDIQEIYVPMGFSNFKIEGRGLGSALILEFLLYYMTKKEYQLKVRENIYLDTMLDLF